MKIRASIPVLIAAALFGLALPREATVRAASKPDASKSFHTSDRCVACHNGLKTSSGEDISIGFSWRASVMANSSRDPYWQSGVRRETIDHPEASEEIQNECSTCHMPMQHLMDRAEGRKTGVFSNIAQVMDSGKFHPAADGVSCSVCHQIASTGLGTKDTFNGNVTVAPPSEKDNRPEYGPFVIETGQQMAMHTSTEGFVPNYSAHIRDAGLCGSCHTLYTNALNAKGEPAGRLPEQMPYLEWLNSDYKDKQSCQDCHMPVVNEAVPVTAVFGQPREGMHRHTFVGSNFLLEGILNEHRDELGVQALPEELTAAQKRTIEFLRTQSARISISGFERTANGIAFTVEAQNLTGHKLPTAYPSRRAWLHVVVRDSNNRVLFESGALKPDGSITGNKNDADPLQFEPHHPVITNPDQVEIFESIMKDSEGHVTTGLISAVAYAKDNRILPTGFEKTKAPADVAVVGEASSDPGFTAGKAGTRYDIPVTAVGQLQVTAELIYQPVGYRWAHNLEKYQAAEPQRWVKYYEAASLHSAEILAKADASY